MTKEYEKHLAKTECSGVQWCWDMQSLEVDAAITGPRGSLYEGGIFRFKVTLPQDYPFKPPSVEMKTKIYHPGVGSLEHPMPHAFCNCCAKDFWCPAFSLEQWLHRFVD